MAYFSRYKISQGFFHHLAFEPVLDLEDGLSDEIEAEKAEQGITLEETADADGLESFWATAVADARKDPKWNFSNDEDNAPLF